MCVGGGGGSEGGERVRGGQREIEWWLRGGFCSCLEGEFIDNLKG